MHDDHDSAHRRGPSTGPRGRRPYAAPADSPPEPAVPPEEPGADPPGRPYSSAGDPFVYGSRVSVDIRPAWPPPPRPIRSHRPRPWPRIPRDRLLRPALVCGFLAAAGIGMWSSGWSPVSEPSTVEVAAAPAPSRMAGHDAAVAPAEATTPDTGHVPAATPSATSGAPAKAARSRRTAPSRTVERPRRHTALDAQTVHGGQDGRRHRESAAPKTARKQAPRSVRPKAPKASTPPRTRPSEPPGETGTPTNTGTLTNAETPATPRPPNTPRPPATPRTPRTSPIPDTSVIPDSPGDRLSAAYACRNLEQSDWRHGYCVRVWNDYKRQNGLP
ncbi:hypothetical protein ABZV14_26680 [Streptosporangium canum]|uniref:hypothetical protein n=1 Tax=Streptosporangium canum TaxID=324952 RepID=UPI0033A412D2